MIFRGITYVNSSILYDNYISMIEYQKKKKISNFIYSPISLSVLFLIFIIILRSVFNVYSKEKISKINLEKEKIEYEKMSSRKDNLLNSIDYLKTDDGVESEIRNKFRLVKEGESVTVIVNNDSMSSISIGTSTKIKSKSLLSSIFEWFSK